MSAAPLARRKRLVGIVASLVTAALIAGCGSGSAGDKDFSGAEPDLSATLRIAESSNPLNFDPHLERNSVESKYNWAVWDRLLMLDHQQNVIPGLATEWTFSEDELTLTLKLREGVEFHDGTPVQADSVKASLERAKTLEGSTAAVLLSEVASIDIIDDYAVALHLSEQAPQILDVLATSVGVVISKSAIDAGVDFLTDPGGAASGAYSVVEFVPNQKVVLERVVDDYWDADAAQFARIESQAITEANALQNAILSGAADIAFRTLAPDEVRKSVEGTDLVADIYRMDGTASLLLNPTIAPLDDIQVRQAIIQAIDRHSIAENLLGGEEVVTDQPVGPDSVAFDPNYEYPYPYDVDAAQTLIDEADIPDDFVFEIIYPVGWYPGELASLPVQQALEDIGITVKLSPVPATDIVSNWKEGKTTAILQGVPAQSNPIQYVERTWHTTYGISPADLDDELNAAIAAVGTPGLTEDERAQAYKDLLATAMDQATHAVVGYRLGVIVHEPYVLNVEEMPQRWSADTAVDFRYLAIAEGAKN